MWTDQTQAVTAEVRRAALDRVVAERLRSRYWRVETKSDFQAVLVFGHRTNHILHLLITVFTLGLWSPIWLITALTQGERREVLTVDEHARVARL